MESKERVTRELVERAHRGDAEAYERLFRSCGTRLMTFVEQEMGRRLRERVEPGDVLQETYAEAVRRFHDFEYEKPGSVYAWLREISRFKIRELYRFFFQRRKRAGGRDFPLRPPASGTTRADPGEAIEAPGTTPTRAARRSEGTFLLSERLSRLPRDYRLVISLLKIEERSIPHAARVMSRSENAVKKLLARALEALRAEFEVDGLENPLD